MAQEFTEGPWYVVELEHPINDYTGRMVIRAESGPMSKNKAMEVCLKMSSAISEHAQSGKSTLYIEGQPPITKHYHKGDNYDS